MDAEPFGNGWAFYQLGGVHGGAPVPAFDDPFDRTEWVNGFAAADLAFPPTTNSVAGLPSSPSESRLG